MAFDVLHAGSQDLRRLPLRARREMLEGLLEGHRLLLPARRLAANGLEAWAEVERGGYEGLVGKDDALPYVGGRTLSWLKVKQPGYRVAARGFRSAEPVNKNETRGS
jgi:bifunctional non-homologous end joining protein LigD